MTKSFDDVLVVASRSLPETHADGLRPWDLEKLVPYRDEFVSGFGAETYQVRLPDAYEKAKTEMAALIREAVARDIGGDRQQIQSVETAYADTTFKHILLPIWISSYRFGDKTFRYLVNARTGEVQGERPSHLIKIALAVLATCVVVAFVVGSRATGIEARLDAAARMSSHGPVRRLIGRLAALVLVASLVSPGLRGAATSPSRVTLTGARCGHERSGRFQRCLRARRPRSRRPWLPTCPCAGSRRHPPRRR